MKKCKVDGCDNKLSGHGYCDKHCQQYRKYGIDGVDKIVRIFDVCKNPICNKEFKVKHRRHFYCCDECKYTHRNKSEEHRESMNKFNCSDKGNIRTKKYLATEKGKKYKKEKTKRHIMNNPDKYIARIMSQKIPISTCSISGCNEKGERHHPDYSKPLDVVSLCRKHHMDLHNNRLTYS